MISDELFYRLICVVTVELILDHETSHQNTHHNTMLCCDHGCILRNMIMNIKVYLEHLNMRKKCNMYVNVLWCSKLYKEFTVVQNFKTML